MEIVQVYDFVPIFTFCGSTGAGLPFGIGSVWYLSWVASIVASVGSSIGATIGASAGVSVVVSVGSSAYVAASVGAVVCSVALVATVVAAVVADVVASVFITAWVVFVSQPREFGTSPPYQKAKIRIAIITAPTISLFFIFVPRI